MKMYRCKKVMCELYDTCTLNRMIPASEQSYPDGDTGEILYFAACPELGETFCDLHEDLLVDVPDAPGEHYSEEDAKSAFAMMNHLLEQAIEYLDFPILHGVVKHGPTKWVVPRERIDMLKELVPHQADEIETTCAKIAEIGFDPHEFLEPGEAFMDTALCPFTEDFFAYRKRTGDYYYSDKEAQGEVNGNKAKYRVAWDELMRALDEVLPAKSSVVRLQSTVKGLLQLFERRLSLGVDAVSKTEYDHALVVLKEKLCDVAADLREQNLTRKNEAEAKRQARAAKRQGLPVVPDAACVDETATDYEGLPMKVANAVVDKIKAEKLVLSPGDAPKPTAKCLAAVKQWELAALLGYKNEDSIRKWESGDRSAPYGYHKELRIKGGIDLLLFINEFRRKNGIAAPLKAIRNGKVIDISDLTADRADDVLEFLRLTRERQEKSSLRKG